jgi:hypothetical protein
MIKLSKYEFKKNKTALILMFATIILIQIYFLFSLVVESVKHTSISSVLLYLVAIIIFFGVFIFGIATYSKELSSKTGYLTFMTPKSTLSIIMSKLMTTLFVGVFFAAILTVLAIIDIRLIQEVYPDTKAFGNLVEVIMDRSGISMYELILTVLGWVASFLILFFSTITIAYLSITLSATLFQNKKFKGLISFIIFVVLNIAIGKISNLLPVIQDEVENSAEFVLSILPETLFMLVVMTCAIIVSAKLLDKKVSL